MKLFRFSVFFLGLTGILPLAWGDILTLGLSTQTVTFTGFGGTPAGQGQSTVRWGDCVFDGTKTTCTVSGTYTSAKVLGGSGTYAFVLTYFGNGPTPLTAISQAPGGNLIFFNLTSGSFLTTFTPANGSGPVTFYNETFTFDFSNATCTGVSPCAVGQEGLTVGATITGPITAIFDTTPVIAASGVITATDFGGFGAIAPASWIEIYGTNLATILARQWGGADFNGNQAPTGLAGTTVTIGGQSAFVDYVSPGQVNVQVPSGVAAGPQPVMVTTVGGVSLTYSVAVNAVEPGILAPAVFKLSAGQYAVALLANGTYVLPPNTTTQVKTARAKPGDVIMLFGVGFGPVTPDSPAGLIVQKANTLQSTFKASFGGTPATVQFAGLVSGFLGLYQFNVVVPQIAASDTVPFTFTLGSGTASTQTLLIPIGN